MNRSGDGWTWDPSKKWITKAVHESLKRLQTDYIDVYQMHGGTMEDDADEVIETMESLKKEGLYGIWYFFHSTKCNRSVFNEK